MKPLVLFFVALWMTLRPLWPLAEYVMNYDYIATVLCENRDTPEMQCNGKCYLSKMLAQEQGRDQKNPFESPLVKADPNPIIIQEIREFSFPGQGYGADPSKSFWGQSHLISSLFVVDLDQPPQRLFLNPRA